MIYTLYLVNVTTTESHKVLNEGNVGAQTAANYAANENLSQRFETYICVASVDLQCIDMTCNAFLSQPFGAVATCVESEHCSIVCVCLMQPCFKYESAGKRRRMFRCQFPAESVPSKQSIHYLVNKLKTAGSLLDKKPVCKGTLLAEDKLVDVGARL